VDESSMMLKLPTSKLFDVHRERRRGLGEGRGQHQREQDG
jgi:hypothetical protein